MREFNENSITQAVIDRLAECNDLRFELILTSLVTHLHDFVREVKLTESEWLAAVQFLADVGKTCTDERQEVILLSDTLGVSVLVITLNHPADQGSAESTVLGPFYWEGAPELPRGSNLADGVKGEPTFYSGRVLSVDGRPIENALLDISEGRYWFRSLKPTFYPVPTDGPVGRMLHKMGRHPQAQRRRLLCFELDNQLRTPGHRLSA
jgi:hydroxyquinol 1,2-dioxygenase